MRQAITLDPFRESRASRLAKRAVVAVTLASVPLLIVSGYRAVVQIKDLTLSTTSTVLTPGVVVRANLASWARVESDARIELVQGQHVEILGEVYLPRNHEPVFDPRPKYGAVVVTLTPRMLAGFSEGVATLRATALGRSQWLRVPPPTMREQPVTIALR